MDQSSGVMVSTLSHQVDAGAARQADRGAADRGGERARDADGRQEEAHPREDRQGQQRGDEAGDDGLRADRALPDDQPPDRAHGQHPGPAGGAHPGRRPLRLGRGRTQPVRLLRPGGVGVRAGGHHAAALHRLAVELGRARSPQRPGAGRPGLLRRRYQPRRHLRRQRADDRRAQFRRGGPGRAGLWRLTSARSGSGEAGSPERCTGRHPCSSRRPVAGRSGSARARTRQ